MPGTSEDSARDLGRALTIRQEALGETHREIGATLLEPAEIARRDGRKERALRLLRQALDTHWKNLDAGYRDVARARAALTALAESG